MRREGNRETRAVLHAASPIKLVQYSRPSVWPGAIAEDMGNQLSAPGCNPTLLGGKLAGNL